MTSANGSPGDPNGASPSLEDVRGAVMTILTFLSGAPTPQPTPLFVQTADEAGLARLGYTRRVLEEAARSGELPAAKVARGWRVALVDLTAWEQGRSLRGKRPRPRPPAAKPAADVEAAENVALLRSSGAVPTRR